VRRLPTAQTLVSARSVTEGRRPAADSGTAPSRCDLPDPERLTAALGAAVVAGVGVATVRLVAHLLMDAPGPLMDADDACGGRRRVDRPRTAGAGGSRSAAGRSLGVR